MNSKKHHKDLIKRSLEEGTVDKIVPSSNSAITTPLLVVLALLTIFFSVLILPIYGAAYYDSSTKGLLLAILFGTFSVHQVFKAQPINRLSMTDLSWLGLISFTALSISWATNENQVIYGLFTTIVLFGCYKLFESVHWTSKAVKSLSYLFIVCLFWAMAIQYYNFKGKFYRIGGYDQAFLDTMGTINTHWIGSLLFILLPFLLFQKERFFKYLGLFLFFVALYLANNSGSAFVTLMGLGLFGIFILYQLKVGAKMLFMAFLGLTVAIGSVFGLVYFKVIYLSGIQSIITEFSSQNDRFWMWQNSLSLFAESPLVGIGKNNWAVAIGENGFNDCGYCSRDVFSFYRFQHAHNAFFQILSEQGIIGLFLYLGLIINVIPQLLKKETYARPLIFAAWVSLGLFVGLSFMYGIVFNFYNHFQGLPVIAVFCLAIINQSNTIRSWQLKISNVVYKSILLILSISGFFYFSNHYIAQQNYKKAEKNVLTAHNLGQTERLLLDGLPYLNQANSYRNLAELYTILGYPMESAYCLNKAIDKDPNDLLLHYDYGNNLFQLGQYEKALIQAKLFYEKNSNYLLNQLLLAKCYHQLGQMNSFQESIIMLNKQLAKIKERESSRLSPNYETQKKLAYFTNAIDDLKKSSATENKIISSPLSNNFLTLSSFQNLPIIHQSPLFSIDEIAEQPTANIPQPFSINKTDQFGIRGWAVDSFMEELAGGVFIQIGDQFFRANYRQERPDVAAVYNNPTYTNSGFSCSIPLSTLSKGNHKVKIWVLNTNSSARYEVNKELVINID